MKCMDPILCYNNGSKKIFRHYSLATPLHKLLHQTVFDCGKCIICRKKRSRELAMRCVLHASLYETNCFLTLTYDPEKEGYNNVFNYHDIQTFKKRLRSHLWRHFRQRAQIFNVHEYGKMGKKHWHLVVFNFDPPDKKIFSKNNGNQLYTSEILHKLWPHGFHTIGSVTLASAMYQAQYTQKDLKYGQTQSEKKAHSKHSGIGKDYFLKHYEQILSLGYVPFNGARVPVPRYFEKLARKHHDHFYKKDSFYDTSQRKRLFTPFKEGEANKKIADLYVSYYKNKQKRIDELAQEWQDSVLGDIFDDSTRDFQQAGENYTHDLRNRMETNHF